MDLIQSVIVVLVFAHCNAWENPRHFQNLRGIGLKSDLTPVASVSRGLVSSPPGFWNPLQMAARYPNLLSGDSKKPTQDLNFQSEQLLQVPVKPLDWRYPVVPEVPRELAVDFQLRQPITPSSVAVRCGESTVLVEARQDLFSNGELIQPSGLTLGGCSALGEDFDSKVIIFEYELQDCNSVLMMTDDELVYTFALTYTPEPFAGTPIYRADSAIIGIQCHYPRLQNVSSNVLMPVWVPFASAAAGEDLLVFSLKLMTDDLSSQRPSNVYFLGDVITFEASVKMYNHRPLRVLVDRCVATQVPDMQAQPSYSFIENHGCFVDGKTTGSNSYFLPQTQTDKIQFQLEAFIFQQGGSPSIYVTCLLKATLASTPTDAQRKSCSFYANGWFAAHGNNQVCGCCDSMCGSDSLSDSGYGSPQWEGKTIFGPIMVQGQKKP
ncbi:zona pellucida sperm-binding protein 3-like [Myxocyprinus asiaticus]|uniref:zona pellucida sperm-binding protein 3-like n=1 Tax=Myxocyprinus asiaticus TaxID=70543 RepID=UPI00222189E0|nr:zona pellucida sperm-binding protein 3-like [Myxocyprinus asiaticus]